MTLMGQFSNQNKNQDSSHQWICSFSFIRTKKNVLCKSASCFDLASDFMLTVSIFWQWKIFLKKKHSINRKSLFCILFAYNYIFCSSNITSLLDYIHSITFFSSWMDLIIIKILTKEWWWWWHATLCTSILFFQFWWYVR